MQGHIYDSRNATRLEVEPLINQWDEEWEVGELSTNDGTNVDNVVDRIRSRNFIPIKENTQYNINCLNTSAPSSQGCQIWFYDANKIGVSQLYSVIADNYIFTTPANSKYVRFNFYAAYGTTYKHDISINYPASYTGYYPANYSEVKNNLGKLGNAIVRDGWNQIAHPANAAYFSFSYDSDGTITQTLISSLSWARSGICKCIANHKYFIQFLDATWGNYAVEIYDEYTGGPDLIGTVIRNNATIVTPSHSEYVTFLAYAFEGKSIGTSYSYKLMCVDLTEIFGAGNEPSSVKQFRQLFPDDYYPYATPGFGDLLWENAAPTSEFAAQTINLPIAEYRKLIIFYAHSIYPTYGMKSMIIDIENGMKIRLTTQDGYIAIRVALISSVGIQFANGAYFREYGDQGDGVTINTYCIPYRIYGIR